MVQVIVQLPEDIAAQLGTTREEIPRRVLEAIALEGYRCAKLSMQQVGELLQFDSRQTARFLAEHENHRPSLREANLPAPDADWESFRRSLPGLLESKSGRYVAIANGQIVDGDADEFTLVERMANQRPGQRVLIQRVIGSLWEETHMDSPEFELPRPPRG